jgi:hypothetical protein
MRWRNWEILLLSEVVFTISMVVNMRWFAGLHSTCWIRVAIRTVLMLFLMAITEVVRAELSILTISLCSLRVGPFLVEGALGMGWVLAVAGAGFAIGAVTFFLGFLTTCTHVGATWVVVDFGGGAGGGGEDSKVDFGVSSHGGAGGAETPVTLVRKVYLELISYHFQGSQGCGGSQLS